MRFEGGSREQRLRKPGLHGPTQYGFWPRDSNDESRRQNPEPIPFPIRIVQDEIVGDGQQDQNPPESEKPRSDQFYPAWDKFLAVQPRLAKGATRAAKDLAREKKKMETQPEGLVVKENTYNSWEQAASQCRSKVDAIVKECKVLNQKYRDVVFDIETNMDCLLNLMGQLPDAVKDDSPPWVKRVEDIFDDPKFFVDGASAADVHQGYAGDCWFLAALMAVTAKKELIDKLCVARDEKVGVYGFVFYRDGEWMYEVIDDKLYMRVGDNDRIWAKRQADTSSVPNVEPKHYVDLDEEAEDKFREQLQKNGTALYFSHCKSNETWLPLIEKAYAKAHGDYYAIEGGYPSEGIEDLTGGVATNVNPEDIMDKDRFWKERLSQVNKTYLFGGGTKTSAQKGFVGSHAYTVLETWEEGDLRLLKIKNPWGQREWEGDWSDGSKLWTPEMMQKLNHSFGNDGIFWMAYKDFFSYFPTVSQVRLFDSSWQISQHWTCVDVPWTVDYLDTKFEMTVTKRGPIVIALSQPDTRYFEGLEGRYDCSLHFRLYKAGEVGNKYIVRSMHSSGNYLRKTRSVSAELDDIEPGKYYVIFKVTATRSPMRKTAESVILSRAIERKSKLLSAGRKFDYAQSKGNLKAMEKFVRKQQRAEDRAVGLTAMKRNRKYSKLERERQQKATKRIQDAVKEKRKKQKEERAEQKAKAKQEKIDAAAASASTDAGSTESASSEAKLTPTSEQTASTEPQIEPQSAVSETNDVAEAVKNLSVEDKSDPLLKAAETAEAVSSPTEKPKDADATEPATDTQEGSGDSSKALVKAEDAAEKEEGEEDAEDADEDEEVDDDASYLPPGADIDIQDVDFDWDSDIDNPIDDDTSSRPSTAGEDIDLFGDDPWNVLLVLGLRVYAKDIVKIKVSEGEETEAEEEKLEEKLEEEV